MPLVVFEGLLVPVLVEALTLEVLEATVAAVDAAAALTVSAALAAVLLPLLTRSTSERSRNSAESLLLGGRTLKSNAFSPALVTAPTAPATPAPTAAAEAAILPVALSRTPSVVLVAFSAPALAITEPSTFTLLVLSMLSCGSLVAPSTASAVLSEPGRGISTISWR